MVALLRHTFWMGDVMDIAGLRRELEEHLKHHPHEQAPEGFRDRFDHWAEAYEAEQDEANKAELEELLRRVPAEAEAAAKCGIEEPDESGAEPAAEAAPRPPAGPAPEPAAEQPREADAGPSTSAAAREEAVPEAAGSSQWLIFAGIALVLAAALYFVLR
jgi:hypothetical protein